MFRKWPKSLHQHQLHPITSICRNRLLTEIHRMLLETPLSLPWSATQYIQFFLAYLGLWASIYWASTSGCHLHSLAQSISSAPAVYLCAKIVRQNWHVTRPYQTVTLVSWQSIRPTLLSSSSYLVPTRITLVVGKQRTLVMRDKIPVLWPR